MLSISHGSKGKSSRKRSKPRRGFQPLEARHLMAGDTVVDDIAPLSDEFDDGSQLAQWQRVHQVENWNADHLQHWDIDQTQSGRMVMQPHSTVWYQDWRGPMAFKEVTGDFVFTTQVHITDRDDIGGNDADDIPGDAQFSLGGVMIRTPRDIADPTTDWAPGSMANDGTNSGENYVFLSLGYGNGANEFSLETKTTRNSNSQLELTPVQANTALLQVAKIGDSVVTLVQFPGEQWQVHRRYTRTDMPETLQVGLVTYTNWEKASHFDPFTHNSSVLAPGQIADPTPGEAFDPDITAGFEFARYARPNVPEELQGVDLVNQATDAQLLQFLGANAATPYVPQQPSEVLDGLEDQYISAGQSSVTLTLPAALADGTPVSYLASSDGSMRWALDQAHNFYADASYHENWGGQNERWIRGEAGGYFYLLPSGALYEWNGDFATSGLLADLSPEVYNDPTLLIDVAASATVNVVDNEITVTPTPGFLGSVNVEVSAIAAGEVIAGGAFAVHVSNEAPTIQPIADQSMSRAEATLIVPFLVEDADGDLVTVSAEIVQPIAYQLDQGLQFQSSTNYHDNWGGQNERWVQTAAGQWYYLLADGTLYQWNGDFATSTEVAQLGVSFYNDPALLTDATPIAASVSIDGGTIVVDPDASYVGTLEVDVTATDGWASTIERFAVDVVDTSLVLDTIAPIELVAGGSTEVLLSAQSPLDEAALTFSAQIVGSLAEQLDAEHQLQETQQFYTNHLGQNERWLQGADGTWFFLLPDGQFSRWNSSFEDSELLATLDPRFYDNPNLVAAPESIDAQVHVDGSTMSVAAGFAGTFQVEVRVNDGLNQVSQIVDVSSFEPAQDSANPVLIVVANQDFYFQEYADTRTSIEAAGLEVVVAAATTDTARPHAGSGQGSSSGHVQPDLALADADAVDYSAIVFVGGWGSSSYQYAFEGNYDHAVYNGTVELRSVTNRLINDFVAQDKYVTAICHGVSVLAWARVDGVSPIEGRTVSAWASSAPSAGGVSRLTRDDIESNGATMVASGSVGDPTTATDDVIVDGRIITAENYDSAALFGATIAELVSDRQYADHVDQIFETW